MLADYRPVGLVLPFAAFALAGAITGWILVQLLREHVDSASFARFTNTILPNETVVLAEVQASEPSRALAIFGWVKGHFTGARPLKSAIQTTITGGLAATAAFLIAHAIA